jgi:hypothetical protein
MRRRSDAICLPGQGPAGMTQALPMDLRSRALRAIRDGMSCRQAAALY